MSFIAVLSTAATIWSFYGCDHLGFHRQLWLFQQEVAVINVSKLNIDTAHASSPSR